jgi:hypothetical protein
MDESTEAQLLSDVLKLRLTVSRLTRLCVSNTTSLLTLAVVLAEDENITSATRQKAIDVFKELNKQIETVEELAEILVTNDGR